MTKKFFVGYVINASYADLCTALMMSQSLNQPVSSGSRMKIGLEMQRFLTILHSKFEKEMQK